MIRYSLQCADGHEFESWFRDSGAYEAQARAGQIECPVCGSLAIEKQIMAPAVTIGQRGTGAAQGHGPQPMALLGDTDQKMRALLRALHAHVAENAENVGAGFAEEARRIHEGLAEARAIYGSATPEAAADLREDGIDVMALPALPDERN